MLFLKREIELMTLGLDRLFQAFELLGS